MDREAELAALVALVRADGRLVDDVAHQGAAAEIRRWRSDGIAVIAHGAPRYPKSLLGVPDAPPLLFARGGLIDADHCGVAVIGTRRPSASGLNDASDCAQRLARDGRVVVSGLAHGIDTAVHHAVLSSGGRTIAVLGTGVDCVYPPENAELQAQIASSAAIVSQFWPELGPTPDGFRRRNALMAGLTRATVIVEAHATSGTRIQARHALAYGRGLILFRRVLDYPWARELALQPGVEVVGDAGELASALAATERLDTEHPTDER